jgi:hypothetical protein
MVIKPLVSELNAQFAGRPEFKQGLHKRIYN